MKTHTKTTLQKLVFERMAPGQEPLTEEEIDRWLKLLPKIEKEVMRTMRFILFGNLSRKLVCRHLGQIRRECTLMLDALYRYPECPDRMMGLYQQTLHCLEQLLEFQQSHYPEYLDQRARMPVVMYLKVAKQLSAGLADMLEIFNKAGVDPTLQAIIAGKMSALLGRAPGSYRQLGCLQALQQWTLQRSAKELEAGITKKLIALMKKLNFSSDGFKHYCKQRIKAKPAAVAVQELPENYRIAVTCSVDALAYLFKLLIAAGLVRAEPKSQLFRFIACSFETPGIGQGSISAHSFTNKYNQVVQATAKNVRPVLLRMLKLLDKEFDLA